jgi:putative ATP-dependent endonuclease of the OLD family
MQIKKIKIKNFKCFEDNFELNLNKDFNILVGKNEAGKTTILEAIHLALTGYLNGRYLKNEISSYLFNNKISQAYISSLNGDNPLPPPEIRIEIFFYEEETPEHGEFLGNANSDKDDAASGLVFSLQFDDKFNPEYAEFVQQKNAISIPIEFYRVNWVSFARDKFLTSHSIPLKSALIDTAGAKTLNGSDMYVSRIIKEGLSEKEKVDISQTHRLMKEGFMGHDSVKRINEKISSIANISNKEVEISVDLATQNAWETSLITFIDKVPFHQIGKGEQCLVKTKLALGNVKTKNANVILIEEPENHLTYGKLNELIHDIETNQNSQQVIISTHSSFVANKLGLKNLILLNESKLLKIDDLEAEDFFKKLPGYDTLRLILCEKAILVEGDSDELIIQRAYKDKHGKLPITDGIDVISVGTSFKRFMEIAKSLNLKVCIVRDNDGRVASIKASYAELIVAGSQNIKLCMDEVEDSGDLKKENGNPFNYNTLEPKIVKENGLENMNKVLKKKFGSVDELLQFMSKNKTECALRIFESPVKINFPNYILDSFSDG